MTSEFPIISMCHKAVFLLANLLKWKSIGSPWAVQTQAVGAAGPGLHFADPARGPAQAPADVTVGLSSREASVAPQGPLPNVLHPPRAPPPPQIADPAPGAQPSHFCAGHTCIGRNHPLPGKHRVSGGKWEGMDINRKKLG